MIGVFKVFLFFEGRHLNASTHFQHFPISGYCSCKGAVQGKEDKKSRGKEHIIISAAFEALNSDVLEKQIFI